MHAARSNAVAQRVEDQGDPQAWLRASPLIDLDDSRLRLRVLALTQLCRTDTRRAMAVYGYVKTLPFGQPERYGVKTARQVLDDGRGGWHAKTTLFIAMLRVAGLPARLRVLALPGSTLRGLVDTRFPFLLPVAEFCIDGCWLGTDTHILDPRAMSLVRLELVRRGWGRGFGVHRNGAPLWDGRHDAFAAFSPHRPDGQVLEDFGVHGDIAEFIRDLRRRSPHRWALHMAHYRAIKPRLRQAMNRLLG